MKLEIKTNAQIKCLGVSLIQWSSPLLLHMRGLSERAIIVIDLEKYSTLGENKCPARKKKHLSQIHLAQRASVNKRPGVLIMYTVYIIGEIRLL